MSRPVVVVTRANAAAACRSQFASRKQTTAASTVAEHADDVGAVLRDAKRQSDSDDSLENGRDQQRNPNPENRHRKVVDDLVLRRVELVFRRDPSRRREGSAAPARPAGARRRGAVQLGCHRSWVRLRGASATILALPILGTSKKRALESGELCEPAAEHQFRVAGSFEFVAVPLVVFQRRDERHGQLRSARDRLCGLQALRRLALTGIGTTSTRLLSGSEHNSAGEVTRYCRQTNGRSGWIEHESSSRNGQTRPRRSSPGHVACVVLVSNRLVSNHDVVQARRP